MYQRLSLTFENFSAAAVFSKLHQVLLSHTYSTKELRTKGSGIKIWKKDCTDAVNYLKHLLCSSQIMQAPDRSNPFRCYVDASQFSVGGTLTQLKDRENDRAVECFSKHMSPTEENYNANDRELLGLVYFFKRFRCYYEGSEFEVVPITRFYEIFPNCLSAVKNRSGSSSYHNLESSK